MHMCQHSLELILRGSLLQHQLDSIHEHSEGSIILSEFAESLLKEKDSEIEELNEHITQLQVALETKETTGDHTQVRVESH